MALMEGWALQGYGERTAALALRAARERLDGTTGMTGNLQNHLGSMICWQSAVICAWLAGGIELQPPLGPPAPAPAAGLPSIRPTIETIAHYHQGGAASNIVGRNTYANLFTQPGSVNSAPAIAGMPLGSFIGFLDHDDSLRHVMIYVGNGLAAGSNNQCIFERLCTGGWEVLDLNYFFSSEAYRRRTRMIFTRVFGQTVRRN
ncbi:MAG: hypothetical protein JWL65_2672 [Gammaproteobacteria bacterium]|nr:hypothetical protein [Gammaproteobacteria bacterium]